MNQKAKLIQLIHVAKGKARICSCGKWFFEDHCSCGNGNGLSLDDETYRALLEGITGKKSSKEMNLKELSEVLDVFRQKGFPFRLTMPDYLSQEKRRMIASIETRGETTLGQGWEKRVLGFLKKAFGKESLRFCTMNELRAAQGFINRIAKSQKSQR